jgi:hypothetical protein
MRPEKRRFLERTLGKEKADTIIDDLETLQKDLIGEGIEFKQQKSKETDLQWFVSTVLKR